MRGKPGVRLLPEEPEEEPPAPAEAPAEDAEGEEGGRHDELPHSGNGDSEPEEGGEGSLGSSSWQLSAGMQAELAFAEDGMVGSWYPVEVLQVRETAVQVLVPGLLDAEQPDGKLREWHPRSRLRPPPPPPGEGFREQLCLGSLAETWYQEGWWQVRVKEIYYGEPESKSGEGGGGSTSMEAMSERRFVLESIQFGNSHRPVVPPPLRPCWRWHPSRQENGGWSLQQSAQRRPQPNNGKRGATKRKQSELTPGAKEIEQEAAARETQRMLQHFAVSNVVEVRGTEDGFLGSWYAARVLEAREARSNVKLRLCYEAFQEDDGSKWEDWIEARHVRPLPPPHKADFVKQLKKGAPLELLLEDGWWEVEFECGPDEGGLCLVSAKRYQVQHTVPVRPQGKKGRHRAAGLSPGAGYCPGCLPAGLSAADPAPSPPPPPKAITPTRAPCQAARLRPAWKWTSDCTGGAAASSKGAPAFPRALDARLREGPGRSRRRRAAAASRLAPRADARHGGTAHPPARLGGADPQPHPFTASRLGGPH